MVLPAMMESALTNLIQNLQDGQPATLQFSTTTGHGVSSNCVYKAASPPRFYVMTPPKTIPADIDTSVPCLVSIQDESGITFTIQANIVGTEDGRTIELIGTNAFDPIRQREYFRVSLRTTISIGYESLDPQSSHNWTLKGQTLDISGSGVLGLFGRKPENLQELFIDIQLTHPQKPIHCIGHVVRITRLRGNRWQVALHFDTITAQDRDAIITNCLFEQRRQLREHVQTTSR